MAAFDPYHRWLGIAADEQPPHHYRLLGLKLFESDADVIESAADRQMAHVRTFQSGPHADDAQRILNEISAARIVLLNAEKKAAYDGPLRAKIDHLKKKRKQEKPLPVAQPLVGTGGSPVPESRSDVAALPAFDTGEPPVSTPVIHTNAPRAKPVVPKTVVYAAIAGGVALLLISGAIALAVRPWESPPVVAGVDGTGATENANAASDSEVSSHSGTGNSTTVVAPPPPPPPNTTNDPGDDMPADSPPVDPPTAEPTIDEVDVAPPPTTPVDEAPVTLEPPRDPIPDKAARDAGRKKIAGIFPLDEADTPEKKAALAGQLLKVARETKDDPTARFMLLNLAREQAADAAQLRLAFEAVDLLEAQYEFDAAPVRLASLGQALKAPLPPVDKREAVLLGIEMMDALVARDEYETAGKLVDPLLDVARRARDKPTIDALIDRRTRIGEMYAAYKRAQSAIATLKDQPDDPNANLSAGRYYLLVKGDWSTALPMLAKSSDEKLAAAAKAEIGRPAGTEQEEKLAAAWWSIAESETDKAAQHQFQSRAMAWYQRAAGELVGLAKVQAQRRIDQLADAGIRPANLAADLGVFSRPPTELGTSPIDNTGGAVNVELKYTDLSPDTRLQTLEAGSFRCTDHYEITSVPRELQGLDLLTVERPREVKRPAPGWTFTVNRPVRVYLLHLNRGEFNAAGWERTDHVVAWLADDRAPFTDTVFMRDFPAGEISVPGHIGRDGTGTFGVPHACVVQPIGVDAPQGALPDDRPRPKIGELPEDGLLAHWTFDEGKGNVARDSAGGHDGRISKVPTWIEGVRGGALSFKKDDGIYVAPTRDDDALEFDGHVTLAAWVRLHALPDTWHLAQQKKSKRMDIFTRGMFGYGDSSTFLTVIATDGGAEYSVGTWRVREPSPRASVAMPLEDLRTWVHLAGVYDGTSWRLYRNGSLAATAESKFGALNRDQQWLICLRQGDKGSYDDRWGGDIDDVRIYNRALSPDEVKALAEAQ